MALATLWNTPLLNRLCAMSLTIGGRANTEWSMLTSVLLSFEMGDGARSRGF